MRGSRLLAAATVLAVAVAACGAPGPDPTGSPPPTPVPTAASADGPVRRAIHVDGVDVATGVIRFTDAQIFFDDAAHQAAREDGHPGGAPNPVWIRDLATTGVLPIDPAARVTLMGHDAGGNRVPTPASVADLLAALTGAAPPQQWDQSPYLLVVIEDGRITAVEQPALP